MYNFSKLAETSKELKNEEIMIIIKELFVNFPRFHRYLDLFVHRDTETQSFIRTQNPQKLRALTLINEIHRSPPYTGRNKYIHKTIR